MCVGIAFLKAVDDHVFRLFGLSPAQSTRSAIFVYTPYFSDGERHRALIAKLLPQAY